MSALYTAAVGNGSAHEVIRREETMRMVTGSQWISPSNRSFRTCDQRRVWPIEGDLPARSAHLLLDELSHRDLGQFFGVVVEQQLLNVRCEPAIPYGNQRT